MFNCRLLPPRKFSNSMCANEIRGLGRGVQAHNRTSVGDGSKTVGSAACRLRCLAVPSRCLGDQIENVANGSRVGVKSLGEPCKLRLYHIFETILR